MSVSLSNISMPTFVVVQALLFSCGSRTVVTSEPPCVALETEPKKHVAVYCYKMSTPAGVITDLSVRGQPCVAERNLSSFASAHLC